MANTLVALTSRIEFLKTQIMHIEPRMIAMEQELNDLYNRLENAEGALVVLKELEDDSNASL